MNSIYMYVTVQGCDVRRQKQKSIVHTTDEEPSRPAVTDRLYVQVCMCAVGNRDRRIVLHAGSEEHGLGTDGEKACI